MPELPEVEITKRKLEPLLGRKRILRFWTDWPRGIRVASKEKIRRDIRGRGILGVERRGKAIIIFLSANRVLAFHQKMSGKVLVLPQGGEDKHIHFRFSLSGEKDLVLHDVRKFGVIWYGDKRKVFEDNYFKSLGRDALFVPFSEFKDILESRKGAIKPLLLRQDVLAGIGNIIADETLWKAKIHPKRRTETLDIKDKKALWEALRYVLRKSISLGGSTMRDWLHPDNTEGGYFQKRFVYGRKGAPCPRCKTKITRMVVGSRGTFICEQCQRA